MKTKSTPAAQAVVEAALAVAEEVVVEHELAAVVVDLVVVLADMLVEVDSAVVQAVESVAECRVLRLVAVVQEDLVEADREREASVEQAAVREDQAVEQQDDLAQVRVVVRDVPQLVQGRDQEQAALGRGVQGLAQAGREDQQQAEERQAIRHQINLTIS